MEENSALWPDGPDDERAGNVVDALLLIKGMAGAGASGEDETIDIVRAELAEPLRRGELLRGCTTLMFCWLQVMRLEDPLHTSAAILNRLRGLDGVTDDDLSTLAGILTSAVLGRSPIAWVERAVSQLSPGEQYGWLLASWLVADLFDHVVERQGAAVELAEVALLESPSEE